MDYTEKGESLEARWTSLPNIQDLTYYAATAGKRFVGASVGMSLSDTSLVLSLPYYL